MSKNSLLPTEKGPFRAEQLRSGDPYELSHGHLLAAGTQFIWVVRLTGPRRVEIYQPGQAMRLQEAIEDCRDSALLTTWLTRAATVDSTAEILTASGGDSKSF